MRVNHLARRYCWLYNIEQPELSGRITGKLRSDFVDGSVVDERRGGKNESGKKSNKNGHGGGNWLKMRPEREEMHGIFFLKIK